MSNIVSLQLPGAVEVLSPTPHDPRKRVTSLSTVTNSPVLFVGMDNIYDEGASKWYKVTGGTASGGWVFTETVHSVAGKTGVVTLDYTTDLSNLPTLLTVGTGATDAMAGDTPLLTVGTGAGDAMAGNTTLLAVGTGAGDAMAGNTPLLQLGVTAGTAMAGDTPSTFPGFGVIAGKALEGNTALLALGNTSTTALAGNTALLAVGTGAGDALAGNTALLQIGTTSTTALAGDTALLAVGTGAGDALAGNTTILVVGTGAGDALAGDTALLTVGTGAGDALAGNTTLSTLTGTVPVASGGTGATTQQAALDALTGVGTNGHILTLAGGNAGWATAPATGFSQSQIIQWILAGIAGTLVTNQYSVASGGYVSNYSIASAAQVALGWDSNDDYAHAV